MKRDHQSLNAEDVGRRPSSVKIHGVPATERQPKKSTILQMGICASKQSPEELLGIAAYEGDEAGVRQAVEAGAPVDAAVYTHGFNKKMFHTAAYWAVHGNHIGVLRYLLADAGADPNKSDDVYGATLCHAACSLQRADLLTIILQHGADPNRRKKRSKWTPCIDAAYEGSADCIRVLAAGGPGGKLTDGTHINSMNKNGKTALDYAEERGKTAAAKVLRGLGAKRAATLKSDSAAEVARLEEATRAERAGAQKSLIDFERRIAEAEAASSESDEGEGVTAQERVTESSHPPGVARV